METEQFKVINGDCLEVLKQIPDHSVSLILTDPPYHSTKKKNITNDTAFACDRAYIEWMQLLCKEWKRVLKYNGSLLCFCSAKMAAQLEVCFAHEFNILNQIVWTKPNLPGFDGWKQKMKKSILRQWYAHSERAIFAEPAYGNTIGRSYFSIYLREVRSKSKISAHDLAEETGMYGKVNHGGAISNWETGRNVPSREQYNKIKDAIQAKGVVTDMPIYEDIVRPFNVSSQVPFTDVWDYPSVRPYKGKHPAEKPLEMLVDIIAATTYEGDTVLDCFAGSGSTAIASILSNRKSISVEIEAEWCDAIRSRIDKLIKMPQAFRQSLTSPEAIDAYSEELPLFMP